MPRPSAPGNQRRLPRWPAIAAVTLAAALAPACQGGSSKCDQQDRCSTALAQIKQLSYEATPRWEARNPGKLCPELTDLREYVDFELRDPWGTEYQRACPDGVNIAVWSVGPDGKSGTDDDIRHDAAGPPTACRDSAC